MSQWACQSVLRQVCLTVSASEYRSELPPVYLTLSAWVYLSVLVRVSRTELVQAYLTVRCSSPDPCPGHGRSVVPGAGSSPCSSTCPAASHRHVS